MARGRTYDLVIKGGRVIGSLRTPRYRADIGKIGGRIVEIGGNIPVGDAERVINGSGRIVATRAVDLRAHPVRADWPHAEGVGHPRDFFDNIVGFCEADKRKIMLENARELTFA